MNKVWVLIDSQDNPSPQVFAEDCNIYEKCREYYFSEMERICSLEEATEEWANMEVKMTPWYVTYRATTSDYYMTAHLVQVRS